MATIAARRGPRTAWADMVDSSQEPESQEVAPPLLHQDSYQDSQASQVCTQGSLCELLQSTAALDAAASSSGAASSGAASGGAAGITRRKHLEEISDEEMDNQPKGQKRVVSEASTPATKRQRSFPMENVAEVNSPAPTVIDPSSPQQTAEIVEAEPTMEEPVVEATDAGQSTEALDEMLPVEVLDDEAAAEDQGEDPQDADDDDGNQVNGNQIANQAALAVRMQKRYNLIAVHKDRDDYRAFNQQFPRHLREIGQPMTPDPTQYGSKRAWESAAQRWREDLRSWYAGWQ